MVKCNCAMEVFKKVQTEQMSLDEFMQWYQSVKTKSYSEGYKEASEIAYHAGSGGEF